MDKIFLFLKRMLSDFSRDFILFVMTMLLRSLFESEEADYSDYSIEGILMLRFTVQV
jgi:hypothetical protein